MKKLIVSILLALPVVALAHAGAEHVMGVISEVAADHIAVKTADGKVVTVQLTADRRVVEGDKKAERGVLAAGKRVVVEAHRHGDVLTAEELKLAAPAAAPAAAPGS